MCHRTYIIIQKLFVYLYHEKQQKYDTCRKSKMGSFNH